MAVKIALGRLAKEGIASQTGSDPTAGVEAALLYYVDRVRSARPVVAPPLFLRDLHSCGAVELVEPAVCPETERVLSEEARRHAVSVEELSAHAVFVYLAELDAAYQETPEGLR